MRHQRDLDRILQLQEVSHLDPAQAVLAGDHPAQLHRGSEDVVRRPVADVVVAAEHRQVHVAVAGMPAPDHSSAGFRRVLVPGEELVHLRARVHHVDDVVAPAALAAPPRLPRA